jgi:membrane protein YqaA with SNARE-associated domain
MRFAVVASIAVTIGFVAYRVLPALERAGDWAYLVGFLVQAVTAATIVVPIPGLAALTVMSQELNIVVLAAAGAAGGAMGELTGYWVGSQGRRVLEKTRILQWVAQQMKRRGALIVTLFAAVPVLPMDAAGMLAGSTRYPIARFLASMFVGKFTLLLVTFLSVRGVFRFVS